MARSMLLPQVGFQAAMEFNGPTFGDRASAWIVGTEVSWDLFSDGASRARRREATFAAEGKDGLLRYDPMSMRPFMSYPEGRYVQRWLDLIGRAKRPPVFAHVNWFQRDAGGRYLWPGYGENLRPLLWLLDFADGRVEGRQTPVGVLPRKEELRLDGLSIDAANLDQLLSVDLVRWSREVESREEHLSQFAGLPEPIWQAHRRLAQALMGGLGGRTTRSSGT